MFPEQQAIADWMTANLFNDGGYFASERVGPEHLIYSTVTNAVLFNYLMDGYKPSPPTWSCQAGEPPSLALFRHLAAFTREFPASWYQINDDDDAYSRLEFVWPARTSDLWQHALGWMQARPAAESGLCRQGLVFHDRASLLEFRYQPGQQFEIYFFGQTEQHSRLVQRLQSK